MRLATIVSGVREHLAICREAGCVRITDVNREFDCRWPEAMDRLIEDGQLAALRDWYQDKGRRFLETRRDLVLDSERFAWAPPYRRPGKIWGIGLNYRAHAADLSESAPTASPASFMKPYPAIAGPGFKPHNKYRNVITKHQ